MLSPNDVNFVIYHNPCPDGTASAWVAHKYLSQFLGNNITYVPLHIGAPPPSNIAGKNVLICDYSFKYPILVEMLKVVNNLLIIDHHKSAELDLSKIDDKHKIFDMNYSGAMLTWNYFFPNQEPPLLLRYIQDRDIWTKKMPYIDEFAFWFNTVPLDFQEYDKYAVSDDLLTNMITTKGVAYKELTEYNIAEATKHAVIKFVKINNKYYVVGYVNSATWKSDIGAAIISKYPLIDFSVVYSIDNDCTSFSLRSTSEHVDVSQIAKIYGGGGHVAASGVKIEHATNQLPGKYLSSNIYNLLDNIFYAYSYKTNILYIYSQFFKKALVKYLIQTKYTVNGKNISVASILVKQKYSVMHDIDVIVVVDYNFVQDTTFYLAHALDIQFLQNLSITVEKDKDIYKIARIGCHQTLTS